MLFLHTVTLKFFSLLEIISMRHIRQLKLRCLCNFSNEALILYNFISLSCSCICMLFSCYFVSLLSNAIMVILFWHALHSFECFAGFLLLQFLFLQVKPVTQKQSVAVPGGDGSTQKKAHPVKLKISIKNLVSLLGKTTRKKIKQINTKP